MSPLLTICITTYNNEKTVKKTLESVLAQTYQNLQILVSDNGSTDKTLEIVKQFTDPRITLRHNIKKIVSDKPYIGYYDNCNGCLESGMIQGEFVAFYHSDDIYEPAIAQKEVEFLIKNPQAGAVFTMGNVINEHDSIIGAHHIPKQLQRQQVYDFNKIFKNILTHGNTFLLTPTFMARTTVFEQVGPFASEGEFGTSADLEMWLRILEKYPIGILQENLIRRRVGGGGKTYNSLRIGPADFFTVMDHYLVVKNHVAAANTKELRQYQFQKDFDNTLRAMHFLIKGEVGEAKKITGNPFSLQLFWALAENANLLRVKVVALKIILYIGINLGLGKYLGKVLYKLI